MTLLLRTQGGCEFDPEHLLDVFGGQRQRFVAMLRDLVPTSGLPRPGAPVAAVLGDLPAD